ncbi:MAG: SAM-dependent methyltransferase [Thermoprotei archaeon]|nr:MAG: SAM-dependent methyltransferase [Thermoprotei archaeon]
MSGISVPFVPTPIPVVDFMLKVANAGPNDVVYDLGCGDGRIPIRAVEVFNVRKAVCVEIRRDLYEKALSEVRAKGLEDKVIVINDDMFNVDVSEATIVTLFLLTSVNKLLRPKLERELRRGARVVSHEFEIPGWIPKESLIFSDGVINHRIYLYIIE